MSRKTHQPIGHPARFFVSLLILLTLVNLLPAGAADISPPAGLDTPLSRWLDRRQPLRFSASFRIDALLPFLDDQLDSINALLSHAILDAVLADDEAEASTTLRLRYTQEPVATIAEVQQAGAYTLRTDLLPNRILESRTASPVALLAGTDEARGADPYSGTSEENEGSILPSGAFDFLSAIDEADGCYRALIDAFEPLAVAKRSTYRIKNIGTARWSQTARLTPEQSGEMLSFLRGMLKCGMDDAYRAELDQARFGKDLVVTLYKASEKGKDMAVYMKGTLIAPDDTTSKLTYQWAFVNDGVQRKDSYQLAITPQKSKRHTRLAEGFLTQKRLENAMNLKGSSQLTLQQGKMSETRLFKVDLTGTGNTGSRNLKGSWSEQVKRAETKDTSTTTLLTVSPDLKIRADQSSNLLSGQVQVERRLDKTITSSLCFIFAPEADFSTLSAEGDFSLRANPEPDQAAEPPPQSDVGSYEDSFTDEPIVYEDGDVSLDLSFLVSDKPAHGSVPTGLKPRPAPADMTVVSLDDLNEESRLALIDEMGQRLAGRLLIILSALPLDDMTLLTDVLREGDLSALLVLN